MARPRWDPRHLPDLRGRTYLVTGSTAGLGYFASEQLAAAGAHVVMTGRNPNRLSAARAAVRRRVPDLADDAIETLLLDTSNLGSIRAAAATAQHRGRIDGLLLNAGIVHPPKTRQATVDGNELVFATNALGHFALAGELLVPLARAAAAIPPVLAQTAGVATRTPVPPVADRGRIVWLGSVSTSLTPYDPVDPQLREDYSGWRAYVQSKVATSALGLEADRRLRRAGVRVESIVAHPGYAVSGRTSGVRGVNEPTRATRFADNLQAPLAQSKEHGAWPLVRALVDGTLEGGDVVGPRFGLRGAPHTGRAARVARREEVAERLWRFCAETARVGWPFDAAARV